MDALDRYMNHSKACAECKPATTEDPVCVPCPTGTQLWNRHRRVGRDTGPAFDEGPSVHPLGGLNEYDDA
jgi:hypothetical protein